LKTNYLCYSLLAVSIAQRCAEGHLASLFACYVYSPQEAKQGVAKQDEHVAEWQEQTKQRQRKARPWHRHVAQVGAQVMGVAWVPIVRLVPQRKVLRVGRDFFEDELLRW